MLIIQPCYSSLDNQAYFNTSHVNVNHISENAMLPLSAISIHLMLMLIAMSAKDTPSVIDFNTSHVNVNLIYDLSCRPYRLYFNTSHVNVNLDSQDCSSCWDNISIHLMLMLIGTRFRKTTGKA